MVFKVNSVKPLKICLISGTFPPVRCGIGDYTAQLVKALACQFDEISRARPEISVLTTDQAWVFNVENQHELEVVKVAGIVSRWNWSGMKQILKWLRTERPNIIHFQYPTALYGRNLAITILPWLIRLLALTKPGWSPTCILTIHEYASFRTLGKIRIWVMALGCHSLIGVSPETVRALQPMRRLGKKPHYIPIGSNISTELPPAYQQDPEKWRQEHGVKTDRPVIGYFGFVSPTKGLPTLIEAFAALEQEAQLLLIAEPKAQDASYSDYFDKLEGQIKSLGLEQKVFWTGFATEAEVAAYLTGATVAVFPYTDGVSLRRTSLLAALANRTPVISTSPSHQDDVQGLVSGDNIWLVPPEDASTLQQALEQLIDDSSLRARLAENGQKLVARFSWSDIALKHLALYLGKLES